MASASKVVDRRPRRAFEQQLSGGRAFRRTDPPNGLLLGILWWDPAAGAIAISKEGWGGPAAYWELWDERPDRCRRVAEADTDVPRTLSTLRHVTSPDGRGPRNVAAMREDPASARNRRTRGVLSAARPCLRRVPAGPAEGVRRPGSHILGVLLLLFVFDELGRARPAVRRDDRRPAETRCPKPGGRACQQRRLPAAALPAARGWGAGGRAGRQRRGGGAAARHSDTGGVLRRGLRAAPPRGRIRGGSDRGQQRSGPRAGSERLRQRGRAASEAGGHRDLRVSAS